MKSRNETDNKIVDEASLSRNELISWMRRLFIDDIQPRTRVLDEVYELLEGEVESNYRKAKNLGDRRRILLKVLHTREVVEAGVDIMEGTEEVSWNIHQGTTVCVLHDLARFRQALMGSFSDLKTGFDHAEEGAKMIEAVDWTGLGRSGLERKVTVEAVRQHSRIRYNGNDPYARLTRDADKLALLRYMPYLVREEDYPTGGIAEKVLRDFRSGKMVRNEDRVTRADIYVSWASWEGDLNYTETKKRYVDEGIKEWIRRALMKVSGEDIFQA